MGDINLLTKLNNLNNDLEENTTSINELSENIEELNYYEKLITSFPSQNEYQINIWDVRRRGKFGMLNIDVTCLTRDEYPQGHNYVNIAIASSKDNIFLGLDQVITAKNGDYKPVQIILASGNNQLSLNIRGGSIDGRYSGIYTFMFQ